MDIKETIMDDKDSLEPGIILDEVNENLDSDLGLWYIIHCYSGTEDRVKRNIDLNTVFSSRITMDYIP